ncbi:MAG: cytidine deaminase [Actinomycetes bacterium]
MMTDIDAEDQKIITLARGAKSRVNAEQGAAVRDTTGRTYSSANVSIGELHLSAIVLATAQAVASGAQGIEAVALCAHDAAISDEDRAVVLAVSGTSVPIFVSNATGDVIDVVPA